MGRRRVSWTACTVVLATVAAGCTAGLRQRGLHDEALDAYRHDEWSAAVRLADQALGEGRPSPAVDAELAMVKADALGHLGFAAERVQLLRYVAAVHGDSRFAPEARAALRAIPPPAAETEPSGAILPAVVVVDRPWLRRPVEIFYPLEASLVGLEGSVLLALEVDGSGAVIAHRVLAASDPAFARAAEGALGDIEVDPEALRGRGAPRSKRVRLDFRLRRPTGPEAGS